MDVSSFKIPQNRLVRTYGTDGFIEKVQATLVLGFKFIYLWPPKAQSVQEPHRLLKRGSKLLRDFEI